MVEKQLEAFLKRASKDSGLDEEECSKLLREEFGRFNPNSAPTYLAYLTDVANQRFEQAITERQQKERKTKMAVENCPFHPDADVSAVLGKYDRYNKEQAWTCSEGGRRCHIRWKMDRMFEATGRDPINWEDFDANKKIIIKKRLEEA